MNSKIVLFLVFITAVASGSTILFLKISSKTLKLILAFSGTYLLGITVLHLIPEIYATRSHITGIFMLAGFLLQILIEYFSKGIEHGHIHIHKHSERSFPLTVMIALSFHSFLEGMPLSGELTETKKSLATGIILHNVPIAIALLSMLLMSGEKKSAAFFWLMLFAVMSPLGALAGNFFNLSELYLQNILAVVVGIFLHVSTTILFESSEEHRFNLIKLSVIIAGMGLSIVAV